jgi:hypothetical protein
MGGPSIWYLRAILKHLENPPQEYTIIGTFDLLRPDIFLACSTGSSSSTPWTTPLACTPAPGGGRRPLNSEVLRNLLSEVRLMDLRCILIPAAAARESNSSEFAWWRLTWPRASD